MRISRLPGLSSWRFGCGATRRVVELARRLNPGIYLIARTRYSQEVGPLCVLGANEAIPEEFETQSRSSPGCCGAIGASGRHRAPDCCHSRRWL